MKIDEFISSHSDRILIAGKVFSVLLVFFWGIFFLEHLSWFTTGKDIPPVSVILSFILHGILLSGYIVYLIKCKYGSWMIIITAALFFFTIISFADAVKLFLISAVPAFLWLSVEFANRFHNKGNQKGSSDDH